jgi:hypothetical protein
MPLYDEDNIPSLDVQINGPFNDKSEADMRGLLTSFLAATGLCDYREHFIKGMFLAQNPTAFDHPRPDRLVLNDDEKEILDYEDVPIKKVGEPGSTRAWRVDFKKWKNVSPSLWRLVCLCALGAAVQGWDESAVSLSFPHSPLPYYIEHLDAQNRFAERNPNIFYSSGVLRCSDRTAGQWSTVLLSTRLPDIHRVG